MFGNKKRKESTIVVYADDVMLWTNNAKELEENLNWLNNIENMSGFRINLQNTISRNTDISSINL